MNLITIIVLHSRRFKECSQILGEFLSMTIVCGFRYEIEYLFAGIDIDLVVTFFESKLIFYQRVLFCIFAENHRHITFWI